MSKQQLLKHLETEVYCRAMPSKSHGVGIFAIRDIPKGTDPFKSLLSPRYYKFKKSELSSVPEAVQEMIQAYSAEENGIIYISEYGLNPTDLLNFMNHSDKPNVATKDGETFKTTRLIKKGEELFSNYKTYDDAYGVSYNEYDK